MDKFKKNQEKRMTDDMSSKLAFVPQCSGCVNNSPPDCKVFKVKPEKYRWNKEECPEKKI